MGFELKGIFVLSEEDQATDEAVNFDGEEIIILLPLDKSRVASGFDRYAKRLRSKAQEIKGMLKDKGVRAKVVVEWGEKDEVVRNASLREYARVLNESEG